MMDMQTKMYVGKLIWGIAVLLKAACVGTATFCIRSACLVGKPRSYSSDPQFLFPKRSMHKGWFPPRDRHVIKFGFHVASKQKRNQKHTPDVVQKSSNTYANVVQQLCNSRPTVMQKSSTCYTKVVQKLCKSRPKVMLKSSNSYVCESHQTLMQTGCLCIHCCSCRVCVNSCMANNWVDCFMSAVHPYLSLTDAHTHTNCKAQDDV